MPINAVKFDPRTSRNTAHREGAAYTWFFASDRCPPEHMERRRFEALKIYSHQDVLIHQIVGTNDDIEMPASKLRKDVHRDIGKEGTCASRAADTMRDLLGDGLKLGGVTVRTRKRSPSEVRETRSHG